MVNVKCISKTKLFLEKTQGCYREFGLVETTRRTVRELIRSLKKSDMVLDISLVTKDLAIGAAPRSFHSINRLKYLGFKHVIDLRAERCSSDILTNTEDFLVHWIPIYDDWKPKPTEFYRKLEVDIKEVLLSGDDRKLFICCGAGEHRAPLAGVLALVTMGYSLERAVATVKKARPEAEFLPAYTSSLIEFLK